MVSLETGHVVPEPALSKAQVREGTSKRLLASRGMMEAVTFSFLSQDEAELFGGGADELKLVNPISSELDVMRPSILPNLIAAAVRGANMGIGDASLFEVGPQYADATPKGQSTVVAGLRVGRTGPKDWAGSTRPVDAFDAKADVMALLEALDAPAGNLQVSTDAPAWYHPGRSGALRLGPNVLATFGELHPKVLKAMDLKGPAVAFEIFLAKVPTPKAKGPAKPFLKLSPFQPLTRDFAFVVEKDVPAEKLVRAAAGADKALISGVHLFDEYQGKGLEETEKSIALQVTLQPIDATLTDEQIGEVTRKIVAQVEKATGGRIRGEEQLSPKRKKAGHMPGLFHFTSSQPESRDPSVRKAVRPASRIPSQSRARFGKAGEGRRRAVALSQALAISMKPSSSSMVSPGFARVGPFALTPPENRAVSSMRSHLRRNSWGALYRMAPASCARASLIFIARRSISSFMAASMAALEAIEVAFMKACSNMVSTASVASSV